MAFKDQAFHYIRKVFSTRKRIIFSLLALTGIILASWVAAHLDWKMIFVGTPDEIILPVKPVSYDEFDMPVDSFSKESITIRSDQFLSEILVARGISMGTIDRIAREFRSVFDVRELREGNELHFYYTPDSLRQLDYMIYKKNPADYVVYHFRDSLSVRVNHKEIETVVCYMEAPIETNIWNAVKNQGVPIAMVAEIAGVFQWMIDPTSLNKGDRLVVIYENQTIDGESIGLCKVQAARFLYGKKWFEAYSFQQNGTDSYFNEIGESLRRAFLKWPFSAKKTFHVSSRFTSSRMHPILRIRRPHYGVDYAAPSGTEVVSIGDGKVIFKGWDRGGGNTLKIKHNGQFTTQYMHLRGYGPGISAGSSVQQGQVIGYVGSTGLSTGPHLDFRVYQNGRPVDPLKVESPPVEPVEPKLRPQYDSIVKVFRGEFEKYKAANSGSAGIL